MARAPISLLLAVVAGACVEAAPDSSYQVADTTFVFSSEPQRGTGSLREVLRIGQVDGPPEYLFARISMLAVGPQGDIFVAQVDGDLRQYDAEGTFVRTVARVGQGPGEIEYVVAMDVAGDGRLAVVDFGNQRVSIYSPEGEFLRQVRRPSGRPGYGRGAIQWDEEGRLWLAINPPRSGPDTLGAQPRPLFARLSGDAEVADTVFLPVRAWEGCERRRSGYAGGFLEDARLPYVPFPQWSRSRDGALAFGCAATYSIDVAQPSGTVMRISRQWQPPVMSDEEHDYYSLFRNVSTGVPRPRFDIPRDRPAFLRMWLTDGGRLWVWPGASGGSRQATAEERESLSRFLGGRSAPTRLWDYWSPTDGLDVFDEDGRWVGHVDTPASWDGDPFPGLTDPYFKGDTIWAVTKDELEVRYVSKFVVEWPLSN